VAVQNITPHKHLVSKENRSELLGQRPAILWFTGLSGSGKSSIAGKVEEILHERGYMTYLLDGDNVRSGLNNNLGFTEQDRSENIRRIGEVAKLFVDSGVIVLTAFISPFEADRRMVRDLVKKGEFLEIYVNCPIEVCEERDVKGLYKKARNGEIKDFTGINSPFEEPRQPEITIRSDNESIEDAANRIIKFITPKIQLA
jgi:adenylylsulfate kinase